MSDQQTILGSSASALTVGLEGALSQIGPDQQLVVELHNDTKRWVAVVYCMKSFERLLFGNGDSPLSALADIKPPGSKRLKTAQARELHTELAAGDVK